MFDSFELDEKGLLDITKVCIFFQANGIPLMASMMKEVFRVAEPENTGKVSEYQFKRFCESPEV